MLAPLFDRFRDAASHYGDKKMWLVGSAAAYAYLTMDPQDRERLIDRLVKADIRAEDMDTLVRELEGKDEDRPIQGTSTGLPAHGHASSRPTQSPRRRARPGNGDAPRAPGRAR